MNLNFTQLLSAFSLALDLGEGKTLSHAKRTAYIAFKLAEKISLPNLRDVYYGGLLHDIGVTKTLSEEHFINTRAYSHCLLGSELVDKLPLPGNITHIINYHHDHFDGTGPNKIKGHQIPIEAQIIFLADQLDIRINSSSQIYPQKESLLTFIKDNSGKLFSPEVVKAFLSISRQESFWLDLQYNNFDYVLKKLKDSHYRTVTMDELLAISEVFGRIIDSKSKFTHVHSTGLSDIARKIAEKNKFPKEDVDKLRIAGLLHDIGKLAVPREIIEKPGRLTPDEFNVVKSHVYFTKYILNSIDGFEEIAQIAGSHHEKLNGSGYTESLDGTQLGFYDRILAVCDIYQALTEERPYRTGDDPEKALSKIKVEVDKGLLCGESYQVLSKAVL